MEDPKKFYIKKIAVLGAGVMGAQIAAHFASADVPVVLFDLPGSKENRNAIVVRALEGLLKLHPAPFTDPAKISAIQVANYDDSLESLRECDLIIEAISERMEWKEDLYKKVSPYISETALLVTNTSGLSVNNLAKMLPANLRSRFFGVHFFNPPGYMPLVELIPTEFTDSQWTNQLEAFLVTTLGKSIVYAKDTPNFIANRIGVFSMLITLWAAQHYAIEFDVVDALTGPLLGRPKSATLRTADVVGLDTFAHAVSTMRDNLQSDPWIKYFDTPYWISELIQRGALGQKTQQGVYKKEGKQILVFDLKEKNYRLAGAKPNKDVIEILKIKDVAQRFTALKQSSLPEAQFLWCCLREVFHYSAVHLEEIAHTVRDADQAMRWGFGWQQGPFELWQTADWKKIAQLIQDDIDKNVSLTKAPLPKWVTELGEKGVYTEEGAFFPAENSYTPRRHLPVYDRQLFPELMIGEKHPQTETLLESDAVRLWRMDDETAILSFKTKMGVIDNQVIDGIQESILKAQQVANGLIVWPYKSEHFSAGANLKSFADSIKKKNFQAIEDMLKGIQQANMALRYSMIPVVAAVQGYALGGGCEVLLHCDAVTAGLRSNIGLVEIGVGVLPAAGGCKEMARRAYEFYPADPYLKIEKYFKQIAMAMVSKNAHEAKQMGFLKESDNVMFNPQEILFVAKQQIQELNAANYRPPLKAKFKVLGNGGLARLMPQLVNMHEGNFISDHDYFIASNIAKVLCGGAIDQDTEVDEQWVLKLERDVFLELAQTKETLARIEHMLETGKPLRN
jgi:3-hydroxyacyl-CoA dehydrogenase